MDRNRIQIYQCMSCTHVFNPWYSTLPYYSGCNMFNCGAAWIRHIEDIVAALKDLPDTTCVEIGAGNGEFAEMLGCDVYEPSNDAEECRRRGVNVVGGYFTPNIDAPKYDGKNPLYIMRHVLEHFIDPGSFLRELVVPARKQKGRLLIEVPAINKALRDVRVEDWVYEHPQHFTFRSLYTLLTLCGWRVVNAQKVYNDEVALFACAPACDPVGQNLLNYKKLDDDLAESIETLSRKKVVYWGGAGKSMMLLKALNVTNATIVDADERKIGCYVPGTGMKIQHPSVINEIKPDCTVITTGWRAQDILHQAADFPCGEFYIILKGKLCQL
jgi:hypothetical protein